MPEACQEVALELVTMKSRRDSVLRPQARRSRSASHEARESRERSHGFVTTIAPKGRYANVDFVDFSI